jgi:hypothetical protein
MHSKRITNDQRSKAWLTEAMSRERAPSKMLEWVIWDETHDQSAQGEDCRGGVSPGMLRIALRLVTSEATPRFKHAQRVMLRRNPLILRRKLKLQN